jgi:hypothetical protein
MEAIFYFRENNLIKSQELFALAEKITFFDK